MEKHSPALSFCFFPLLWFPCCLFSPAGDGFWGPPAPTQQELRPAAPLMFSLNGGNGSPPCTYGVTSMHVSLVMPGGSLLAVSVV